MLLLQLIAFHHDDVIKWKHFPRYWPFVREIHRSPVNFLHKGQWRGALIFALICVRINGWVNNREAGDLRRYRAHYDVIVMITWKYLHTMKPSLINCDSLLSLLSMESRVSQQRKDNLQTYPQNLHLDKLTLTHWGRDNMASILQTTFWSAFSWMGMHGILLKFHWSMFPKVHLSIFQHWFR